MIDIMQVLDKANEDVSGLFRAYCIEQGKIPKEVCISAKAKGIKKYFVCQLFNDGAKVAANPATVTDKPAKVYRAKCKAWQKKRRNDLPSGASPCGDGTGGETEKENQTMKKKPTAKKPTAAKVAAKPAKKPATAKKPAKVAAKPAPAKKSAKKSAKK